jgi:hypothetical protein
MKSAPCAAGAIGLLGLLGLHGARDQGMRDWMDPPEETGRCRAF